MKIIILKTTMTMTMSTHQAAAVGKLDNELRRQRERGNIISLLAPTVTVINRVEAGVCHRFD